MYTHTYVYIHVYSRVTSFHIGVVIGFSMTAITVNEGSGSVEATVMLNGTVNSRVMVGVSTLSRTALG